MQKFDGRLTHETTKAVKESGKTIYRYRSRKVAMRGMEWLLEVKRELGLSIQGDIHIC